MSDTRDDGSRAELTGLCVGCDMEDVMGSAKCVGKKEQQRCWG
jgi:hypothetical protein